MSDNIDLIIRKETFSKISDKKKAMGFGEQDWDEWLNHILNNNLVDDKIKTKIEKKWEEVYYNKFYDEWVQYFALNLNDIWNESSAKDLDPTKDSASDAKGSAIVIGRGPSIKKYNHLELLAKSDYQGSIVCTDGALINALKAGITPDKFPKYYVVTIDSRKVISEYYNDDLVDKYGDKIKGIFSTVANPITVQRARQAKIKIHWLHALFDYNEGKKSFNQMSALMVRANRLHGLPAIQTGGNVGTSAWFVSWKILKCSTVSLIGINHGWSEDDPLELIKTHGYTHSEIKIDENDPVFSKVFPKVYNPEFKCYCILDPIFKYYSTALKEFISRSPDWLTTVNATEGGCIFGEKIKCITLANFLSLYKN